MNGQKLLTPERVAALRDPPTSRASAGRRAGDSVRRALVGLDAGEVTWYGGRLGRLLEAVRDNPVASAAPKTGAPP